MKNRPLFYVFAGVILGEGCFCISRIMAGAVMAFCLMIVLGQKRHDFFHLSNKITYVKIIIKPLMIGFFTGFVLMQFSQLISLPEESISGTVTGTIAEIGAGKTEVIRLKPYAINGTLQEGSVLLYGKTENLLPGNKVCLEIELEPYESPRNPGQFDLKQYYRCRGIYYSGFYEEITVTDASHSILKTKLLQLKRYSIEKCLKYLSEEDAGILCAALLGEKSYLDTHLKELYQENGIAHILAISGLHISIIGGSLYHLLRKLGLPFFPAGMMSFLIMIPYCLMIGNGVAAVRAVVMLIIFIGADIKGRHYDFLTSASIAGALILYESPYYLFDAGFLLSFGAVFAIGCVYPCFEKIKYGQPLWLGISIWLVLLPIQLWFFYEISIASIFLNFVVVPLMPVVVSFGLIGILTPFIFSFSICHWILRLYQWLLVFPAVVIGQPGWYFVVLYAVLLIVGCYFIRNRNHYLSIACIFAGIFALYLAPMHGFFVTFLDVGQGDCIVVHSLAGHTYMIDGGSSDISKVGTYRIVPYLKSQGIRALDYVIVTHFDEDHYSGIQEMIESGYPMKNLIVFQNIDTEDEGYKIIAELAKRQGISILRFSREDQLQEGELSLTCLFPNEEYTAEKNQQSLVFLLNYKEFDCLLTGDLEKQGEEDLCKYDLPEVEILKVGHHGSKNASSEEFLSKINPLYAVISCGINNRYHHPHADTINRLKKRGSNILVTAECGAVMVKEKRGIIRMEGYLLK